MQIKHNLNIENLTFSNSGLHVTSGFRHCNLTDWKILYYDWNKIKANQQISWILKLKACYNSNFILKIMFYVKDISLSLFVFMLYQKRTNLFSIHGLDKTKHKINTWFL
jgi:hypothetical protein